MEGKWVRQTCNAIVIAPKMAMTNGSCIEVEKPDSHIIMELPRGWCSQIGDTLFK